MSKKWMTTQKTIICFITILFLSSCSSKKNLTQTQSELYFSAGTQSLMEKEYTAALTSLLKANEMDPDNADILINLGMAYYFKGEKDMAIKHLLKALKIDEEKSDAKVNLASIYFTEGKYSEAEKLYKQVLKDLTYDKQARTLYNLGLIQLQWKKDTSAAENYFKLSTKEDENYCPSFFQLGLIQFNRKQINTAYKNFKEASAGTCYESPAPHYYQGLCLMESKKFDEARMKFEEIDSRFKKSPFAQKARAKSLELRSIEINQSQNSDSSYSSRVLKSPSF
jgi:Tfp pilus assembly protein PilF